MKKILIGFGVLLVVIQFVRIDKTNPPVDVELDFIHVTNAPEGVAEILKSTCYDCHSNETKYPWYSNVAPVSWWLKDHVNEGRDELNFSSWDTYENKRKKHKMDEAIEMVEEGEMPLASYTITHGEAKLTEEQKQKIMDWFKYVKDRRIQ